MEEEIELRVGRLRDAARAAPQVEAEAGDDEDEPPAGVASRLSTISEGASPTNP